MALVVPIHHVLRATDNLSKRNIYKMRDVLVKQGQIEPMQVQVYCTRTDGKKVYIPFYQDVHANEMLAAMRLLEWDTVLIVEVNSSKEFQY